VASFGNKKLSLPTNHGLICPPAARPDDDINERNTSITIKKKWRYATQTAAKKKEFAENHKRARAEEKGANKEIVPKQAEETKRLKTLVTELERTTVLLTQPAPETARSTYLKS
jgi:hypothetical protein